jgi:hypothetical protein
MSVNTNVANSVIRNSYARKLSVRNRTAVKSIVAVRVVVNCTQTVLRIVFLSTFYTL